MARLFVFLYGIMAYIMFLGIFLYAIAFVGNLVVPKTVDTPSHLGAGEAIIIDLLLLGLFGIQHSGMARRAFKKFWMRIVPPAIERSTFVYASNLALALLMWQWKGLDYVVWNVQTPMLRAFIWGLFGLGWLWLLLSTFAVSHADLFGLRQVYHYLINRLPTPFTLKTGSFYAVVRHPLMLGFVIAFWSSPTMTGGHFLFSFVATSYIVVAIQLEEQDLIHAFGERYRRYRRQVPMLLPLPRRRHMTDNADSAMDTD
ncbi:MAG TPA: isoprenylcysteine carboxylmethyltransferase family protein [Pseudomonadales bacterium]|nr:isoprenylcysteine carboxylmethyltransferase family protein [Pseudomonadales bacterium]